MKSILSCSVGSFDGITQGERNQLFDPLHPAGSRTCHSTRTTLATALRQGGHPARARPGLRTIRALSVRNGPVRKTASSTRPASESFDIQLRICRLDGLRTNEFSPFLQRRRPTCPPSCNSTASRRGRRRADAQLRGRAGNCPGNFLSDTTCLRVPDVNAGDGIVLEGVNFISIDSHRPPHPPAPSTVTREVDAFVFGDLGHAAHGEVVDGQTVTIRDCRVHDRITFVVPPDLPPADLLRSGRGTQRQAASPSSATRSSRIRSSSGCVPPPTSASASRARPSGPGGDLRPAWFGSDEVRVRVRAYPITASLTDLTLGDEQAYDSPGARGHGLGRPAADGSRALRPQGLWTASS